MSRRLHILRVEDAFIAARRQHHAHGRHPRLRAVACARFSVDELLAHGGDVLVGELLTPRLVLLLPVAVPLALLITTSEKHVMISTMRTSVYYAEVGVSPPVTKYIGHVVSIPPCFLLLQYRAAIGGGCRGAGAHRWPCVGDEGEGHEAGGLAPPHVEPLVGALPLLLAKQVRVVPPPP